MHLKTPQPEGVNMHEWMLRQVAPAAIGCRFIKMVHQKQRHLMNIQPKAHHRICSSHQQHVGPGGGQSTSYLLSAIYATCIHCSLQCEAM